MRFMVMVMATKESESGPPPKPEAFAAMQKYNEEAVKAGVLLAAEGLTPSSKGARVKFHGDRRTVIDGPFHRAPFSSATGGLIPVSRQRRAGWRATA